MVTMVAGMQLLRRYRLLCFVKYKNDHNSFLCYLWNIGGANTDDMRVALSNEFSMWLCNSYSYSTE